MLPATTTRLYKTPLLIGIALGCFLTNCTPPGQRPISTPALRSDNLQEVIQTEKTFLAQTPEDTTAHYRLALAYFKQGNYPQAEEHIKQATRLAPLNGLYFELLGELSFRTKRYAVAINAFKSAIRLQADLLSAYLKLALVYEQSNENERAIATLEEGIHREPQYVEALYHLARLHLKQQDYESAGKTIQAGLVLEPNNEEMRLLQIQIHSAQGNYYHAKILTDRFLEEYPDSYEAQHEQLKILFAQQTWQAALASIKHLEQTQTLRLEDQLIHVQILIQQNQLEAAKTKLKSLLKTHPLHTEVMVELASLLIQKGELDNALVWLNRSVEIDNQQAHAYFLQASIFFKQGHFLQGDLALNRALAFSPLNQTYQLLNLRRQMMGGEVNAVSQALQELIKKAPLDAEILRLQADLYTLQGQYDQAETLIRNIQLIRDNDILHFSLGRVLYFKRQYRAVLPITTALIQKYPDDWESAYLHATTLYRLGNFEEAVQLLSPFLEKEVGEGFIHLLVGNFHRYQTQEIQAQEIYVAGLETFPQNFYLTEALSASYLAQKKWNLARRVILSALEQAHPFQTILLDRMAYIASQMGDPQESLAYLQRYHQMTDPVLKANNVSLEKRLLFPVASPVLGYSELTPAILDSLPPTATAPPNETQKF